MSRIKLLLAALLTGWMAPVSAVTFVELAEKNARLIELKADLALAKAESELAEQRAKGQAGSAEKVPAIQLLPKAVAAPVAKPAAPAEEVIVKSLMLTSIQGKEGNLSAEFQYGDTTLVRRIGEKVQGWQIVRIGYPNVMLKRSGGETEQCRMLTLPGNGAASFNC